MAIDEVSLEARGLPSKPAIRNPCFDFLVRLVLHLLIACAFVAFILIQVFKPLIWFRSGTAWTQLTKYVNVRNHAQYHLVSPSLAKTAGFVLNSNTTEQVMWTMAPVWAAAVCAAFLYELRKASPRKRRSDLVASIKAQAKRVLFYQLPPRGFWAWLCGGMHVLDFVLVLTWLAFNLMWAYFTVRPKYNMIRGQIAAHKVTKHAARLNMANQTASCIGTATMFSMTLLFFPVPRNSFLHYIFNTDFSGMLKYHRWLGYGVAYTAIAHGLMYYIYWIFKGGWYDNWKKWGDDHSNNLAGTIAMFFLLMILFTSPKFVRRCYFQVFIRCHIVGFVGFTVFTYIHYWQRWWYQTPGIVLLALDWTFRLAQWLHPSFVSGQFVTFDKSVITIRLTWKKTAEPRPGQFMFLNMPTGRRFQWHPVTVADVEQRRPGTVVVTAHMKCYGAWTSAMVAQMLERGKVLMRVDGPYGRPYGPGWHSHDALVIFAGGIGATPMLGMLRDIAAQRRQAALLGAASSPPFPTRVYFFWASRGVAEFSLLDSDILDAIPHGWLDIRLFCTANGGAQDVRGAALTQDEGEHLIKSGLQADRDSVKLVRLPPKSCVPIGHKPALASPYFFRPGVLEAYGSGLYWAAAASLAFVGAFFALLMSAAFDSNLALTGGDAKANWKTGLLVVIATFVGSMGLPALLIFPYNILRYRSRRSHDALAQRPSDLDTEKDETNGVVSVQDCKVGSLEEGPLVRVEAGRPQIASILAELAAKHRELPCLGVFAAGPPSMTAEVRRGCVAQNDAWKRPYCDFSSHAFDL